MFHKRAGYLMVVLVHLHAQSLQFALHHGRRSFAHANTPQRLFGATRTHVERKQYMHARDVVFSVPGSHHKLLLTSHVVSLLGD